MPRAIGKSKAAPIFLRSAGARLTVTRSGGNGKTRVTDRGADAIAALAYRRVGQADHGDSRQPGGDVNLDRYWYRLHAGDCRRRNAREHALRSATFPPIVEFGIQTHQCKRAC